MKSTRITVALTVAICATIPLMGLAHLSPYIYQLDFFDKMFRSADVKLPVLTSVLLPFGPLAWWSYLTPVALAVAVAASLRTPVPPVGQILLLAAAILQSLIMVAVAKPYFIMTSVMGYFIPEYPPVPLAANLTLMGASTALAVHAIVRMRRHYLSL
ncbi:MAG: hypothetical protein EOP88_08375 [Verrucomicrobiaceae bacterium]|nr:MAG: hypothetical protein EOP88_08375 [Verrucomicrobiaceae bacterium]